MNKIKCLIIDDERYAREELRFLLEKFKKIEIIDEAENGHEGLLKTIEIEPDVVFIDIEMPKMNGMAVAEKLSKMKQMPLIVFSTAFPDFAVEAFRINAVDYLLKPYDLEQLSQAIDKVYHHYETKQQNQIQKPMKKLPIENDGEIDFVQIKDIIYIYPENKQSCIVTKRQKFIVRDTLKALEQKLGGYHFFRIHRSYLVNLDYVAKLTPWFNGAYELELEHIHEKLPVSRNYIKALQDILEF